MKTIITGQDIDNDMLVVLRNNGGGPFPAAIAYSDGHTENTRLAISNVGSLMRLAKRSRRRGDHLDTLEVTSITITLPATKQETPAQAYANNLRQYRDYFLKHAAPYMWQNIREDLTVISDEALDNFAQNDCADSFAAWSLAGEKGLPRIEQHKTITLESCKCPDYIARAIALAINNQENFTYSWRSNYDYHASGKTCDDGIYRAWLSQEFKGCGNGHYWLLINDHQAIFCEDD